MNKAEGVKSFLSAVDQLMPSFELFHHSPRTEFSALGLRLAWLNLFPHTNPDQHGNYIVSPLCASVNAVMSWYLTVWYPLQVTQLFI